MKIKILHPKFAFGMFAVPFILLCPLVVITIFTGFPIENILNNMSLDKLENYSREMETIDEITVIRIDSDVSNVNNTCSIYSAIKVKTNLIKENVQNAYANSKFILTEDLKLEDQEFLRKAELIVFKDTDDFSEYNLEPLSDNEYYVVLKKIDEVYSRDLRCFQSR